MGNRGAFITLNGSDMKPYFTSYEAMVCFIIRRLYFYFELVICLYHILSYWRYIIFLMLQPHPNVRPMAYANSLLKFMC